MGAVLAYFRKSDDKKKIIPAEEQNDVWTSSSLTTMGSEIETSFNEGPVLENLPVDIHFSRKNVRAKILEEPENELFSRRKESGDSVIENVLFPRCRIPKKENTELSNIATQNESGVKTENELFPRCRIQKRDITELQKPHFSKQKETMAVEEKAHFSGHKSGMVAPEKAHFSGQKSGMVATEKAHFSGQKSGMAASEKAQFPRQKAGTAAPEKAHFSGQKSGKAAPEKAHFSGERAGLAAPEKAHFSGQKETLKVPEKAHFSGQKAGITGANKSQNEGMEAPEIPLPNGQKELVTDSDDDEYIAKWRPRKRRMTENSNYVGHKEKVAARHVIPFPRWLEQRSDAIAKKENFGGKKEMAEFKQKHLSLKKESTSKQKEESFSFLSTQKERLEKLAATHLFRQKDTATGTEFTVPPRRRTQRRGMTAPEISYLSGEKAGIAEAEKAHFSGQKTGIATAEKAHFSGQKAGFATADKPKFSGEKDVAVPQWPSFSHWASQIEKMLIPGKYAQLPRPSKQQENDEGANDLQFPIEDLEPVGGADEDDDENDSVFHEVDLGVPLHTFTASLPLNRQYNSCPQRITVMVRDPNLFMDKKFKSQSNPTLLPLD